MIFPVDYMFCKLDNLSFNILNMRFCKQQPILIQNSKRVIFGIQDKKMPSSTLYTLDYENKQEVSGGLLLGPKIYEAGSFRKQTHHDPPNMFEDHSNSNIQPCKKIVIENIKIVKVISGRIHTHIITDLGRVYSCGLNSSGCLGCGFDGDIELDDNVGITAHKKRGLVATVGPMTNHVVIDGSCGGYHSIFVTQDNIVYVCGKNSSHQCGFSGM